MINKKICGIGINDACYLVRPVINGKDTWCPYYRIWNDMIRRCYCKKFQTKWPSYIGCQVCEEWKLFSNFKTWMETQDWQNKQIDKDIIGNGKLYSPDTCCFVPGWLNTLFLDANRSRGEYPIGVSKHGNSFQSRMSVDGKSIYLGMFDSPEEAHQVYIKAKKKHVFAKIEDYTDFRVKLAVLRLIES